MNYHIIAKGESLWSIAQMHNCSLAELLAANPQITNPNNIALGEKIYLPEGCANQPQPDQPGQPTPLPAVPGDQQFTIPGPPLVQEAPQADISITDMPEAEREKYCAELANLPRPLIYVIRKTITFISWPNASTSA